MKDQLYEWAVTISIESRSARRERQLDFIVVDRAAGDALVAACNEARKTMIEGDDFSLIAVGRTVEAPANAEISVRPDYDAHHDREEEGRPITPKRRPK